jgi:2-O-methyltransferase
MTPKNLFLNLLPLLFTLIFRNASSLIHYQTHHEAMAIIKKHLPSNPVILEAGAYDGKESIDMLRRFPTATIHCFEPIPYLYQRLQRKSLLYRNKIKTYNYALSDSNGFAEMYVSEEKNKPGIPSQSSSLLEPKDHLVYSDTKFKNKIIVPTITIDEWAKINKIDKIDFMWLDMQGYELNALKASPEITSTVKVIVTEVEFVEAYKDQYLFEDVKKWLEDQGFTMVAENFGTWGDWFGDAIFVRE